MLDKFTLQQKSLAIVIPIIILLSTGYGIHLYQLKSEQIDQAIKSSESRLHLQFQHNLSMMIDQRYRFEIKALLLNPGIMKAIKNQDRETLLKQTRPAWELLRQENPYIQRLHFHNADGISLLRLHLPEVYGDNIAAKRPALQKIRATKQGLQILEMGAHGLFYRIMQPVFDAGAYIGSVELGFTPDYLLKSMNKSGIEGLLFIEKDALGILKDKNGFHHSHGNFAIWSEEHMDFDWLENLPPDHNANDHHLIQGKSGATYLLHDFELPVLEGSPKALIFVAEEMTALINERDSYLTSTILVTLAIIIMIVLTLHYTLSPLLVTLQKTNEKLSSTVKKVTQLSITDPLTGTCNRQKFNEALATEIGRAVRYQHALALIMFDIDHFKQVNDRHGHHVGDTVLQECTKLVSHSIRSQDVLARWGGEEFMVILPHQNLESAAVIAEKLRAKIEFHAFPNVGRVTVSCGVTAFQDDDNFEIFTQRVDELLYQAKAAGRNRIMAS